MKEFFKKVDFVFKNVSQLQDEEGKGALEGGICFETEDRVPEGDISMRHFISCTTPEGERVVLHARANNAPPWESAIIAYRNTTFAGWITRSVYEFGQHYNGFKKYDAEMTNTIERVLDAFELTVSKGRQTEVNVKELLQKCKESFATANGQYPESTFEEERFRFN